jgi:hypothetical protein
MTYDQSQIDYTPSWGSNTPVARIGLEQVYEGHFYNKTARRSATLEIAVRTGGDRRWLEIIPVSGKREANRIIAERNASPESRNPIVAWNF